MPKVSIDLDMVRVTNQEFVKKAEDCMPELHETMVKPAALVDIVKTDAVYPQVKQKDSVENLSNYHLAKGDKICLYCIITIWDYNLHHIKRNNTINICTHANL